MTELTLPAFNKPIQHIKMIIDEALPYSEYKNNLGFLTYSYNGKDMCYLLLKGQASLHRKSDGVILYTENAPAIIFINGLLMKNDDFFYLRIGEGAQVRYLTLERLNLIIERSNLWKSLSSSLIYQMSMFYKYSLYISQLPIRDAVVLQLQQLMKEDSKIRNNITAVNYIMFRTSISRSSIIRNIEFLKNNKMISLERGVLVTINNDSTKESGV